MCRQTRDPRSSLMNIRVRQVPSWMDCGTGRATSPVVPVSVPQSAGTAGTAVRLATAKAPDGAGSVAAAGHVVAPALSCDGPGLILSPELELLADGLPDTVPEIDTNRCYPARRHQARPALPKGDAANGADRDYRPARPGRLLPDRPRGDRPRRAASGPVARARSGFGRAVSLSSEPAPQNRALPLPAPRMGHKSVASRICHDPVASRIRHDPVAGAPS